jgi:F-type H+-transporting ATPase subunit delta
MVSRLATRYAKSLIDFAVEQNQLDVIYSNIKYLQALCKNRQFVNMLRSPVIHADKKKSITHAIVKNSIGNIAVSFIDLLIAKNRENELPEITEAFIDQYNDIKQIHIVQLTTAVEVSDAVKNEIVEKVKSSQNIQNVELQDRINSKLIGGFVLEFDNKLLDASIFKELVDIKKQFSKNVFVRNIR